MALNFKDRIAEVSQNIDNLEEIGGKNLLQPFSQTNSGSRKIMHSIHRDHIFPLLDGEKAIIETGYEIRFGDYSSSISKADTDYQVIAKISKYSFAPNHHYWLILKNLKENKLDIQERICYEHITESYGFLYNNQYLDNLNIGDTIPKSTIVRKSLAFDQYNNRTDGRNFNVIYMSLDDNMEDSLIFSEEAAKKLVSPLINPVEIMINDNDIAVDLYGDGKTYKAFPDIGEEVKNANLIALRKEKKEEAFYTQSVDNLRNVIMSDDIKQVHGRVIDIDIYCNKPEVLENHHCQQFKLYYDELQRCSREAVQFLMNYASQGYEMSYDLQYFFANAKRICNKDQYIDKRVFSNIEMKITVLEELPLREGDKASNRFGGKGVLSSTYPLNRMPRYKNAKGEYEYVDVIFNTSTMYGRENPGQNFELSLNHISAGIIDHIIANNISLNEAYKLIYDFVNIVSPEQAQYMNDRCSTMNQYDLSFFIDSIIKDGVIHLSVKPLSNGISIDKLNEIYKKFPFVQKNDIEVPMMSSDGTYRYVKARCKAVVGKEYMFRLKQFAEEKFSATSLSSTNIKNENTKSKNKKEFKSLYSNTPIRFGNMETNQLDHLGAELVVANLMIHSISPQGRRLVEQMYTCDPFSIDIKLDSDSKNRSAEIANIRMKVIGRRLKFEKIKKQYSKLTYCPIKFTRDPLTTPIRIIPENERKDYDYDKALAKRQKDKEYRMTKCHSPIKFYARK